MVDTGSSLNCPAPGPWRYIQLGIGRTNFSLMAWLASTRNEIGIWLCMEGDNAKAHFRLLEEQQEEIHNAFGQTLEYNELPESERSRICLNKVGTDPLDENDWRSQYEWFTTRLERFDKVFRPRITALNSEDWIPENDDE